MKLKAMNANHRNTATALLVASLLSISNFAQANEENANITPQLSFAYSSDFMRNQQGGLKEGSAYIDVATIGVTHQIQLESDVQLSFLASAIYANGSEFSGTIVGDSQGVSSAETGVNLTRIYETYVDISSGNHSLLLGLFDTNSEFDVLESAGLFVNSAHGMGNTIGASGANGPSIYPIPGLSVRYQFESEQHTFRTVISDGIPGDENNENGIGLDVSSNDGYLNIVEWEYRQAQTKWLTGVWHYNKSDLLNENDQKRNLGLYVRAEHNFANIEGLTGFARIGKASSDVNLFDKFYSAGLVKTGVFGNRDEDQLGVAFAFADLSEHAFDEEILSRIETTSGELNIELTYSAKVNAWLSLQPTIQWIKNPSALKIENALVFGIRTSIEL